MDEKTAKDKLKAFEEECRAIKVLAAELHFDKVVGKLDSELDEAKEKFQTSVAKSRLDEAKALKDTEPKKSEALMDEALALLEAPPEGFDEKTELHREIEKLKEELTGKRADAQQEEATQKAEEAELEEKKTVEKKIDGLLKEAEESAEQGNEEEMKEKFREAMQTAAAEDEHLREVVKAKVEEIRKKAEEMERKSIEEWLKAAENYAEQGYYDLMEEKLQKAVTRAATIDEKMHDDVRIRTIDIRKKAEATAEEKLEEQLTEAEGFLHQDDTDNMKKRLKEAKQIAGNNQQLIDILKTRTSMMLKDKETSDREKTTHAEKDRIEELLKEAEAHAKKGEEEEMLKSLLDARTAAASLDDEFNEEIEERAKTIQKKIEEFREKEAAQNKEKEEQKKKELAKFDGELDKWLSKNDLLSGDSARLEKVLKSLPLTKNKEKARAKLIDANKKKILEFLQIEGLSDEKRAETVEKIKKHITESKDREETISSELDKTLMPRQRYLEDKDRKSKDEKRYGKLIQLGSILSELLTFIEAHQTEEVDSQADDSQHTDQKDG